MDAKVMQEVRTLLERAPSFVHATHVNPDADGLGSALAVSRWLRSRGKQSRVVVTADLPRRLQFLAEPGEIEVIPAGAPPPDGDSVFILYDVSSAHRFGDLRRWLEAASSRVLFDHHDGEVDFPALALVDVDAGATAQLVADCFEAWDVPLDIRLALPLYVGILADTGSFNFGKTSPHTHRVAARLLEAGVNPLAVHGLLQGSNSLAAIHGAGRVMTTIAIDSDEPRLAHATLDGEAWREAGADGLDTVDLVNQTISLDGVLAGVLLIEVEPDLTRLSLRSKGEISIVEVAQTFGGGGHRNASGAMVRQPTSEVRPVVLERLRAAIRRQAG